MRGASSGKRSPIRQNLGRTIRHFRIAKTSESKIGEQTAKHESRENKCGPETSHPGAASFVDLRGRLPVAGQRADGTGPTALPRLRVPHLPLQLRNRDSQNHNSAAFAVADGPTQLIEQVVEEAAVPGQPAHACACFRFSPAIHPRESPVCRWRRRKHRSASLGKSYVFGEPTVRQMASSRN
jgi:hypothetical protein